MMDSRRCSGVLAAYRTVAQELSRRISDGTYPPNSRLPTETALCQEFGISRHTVREAVNSLVDRGEVRRVQGSGTYILPAGADGTYQKAIGFLDDLTTWPNTTAQMVEPFTAALNSDVARKLQIPDDTLVRAIVRRSHNEVPFAFTHHYMASTTAALLEVHGGSTSTPDGTIIGAIDGILQSPISTAVQEMTAITADQQHSQLMGCALGDSILLIERIYYDEQSSPVEYTASHLNPRRYRYRTDLRR